MTKTLVTVHGNLCADPVQRTGRDTGAVYTTLRIASTPRRLDRATGEMVDEGTSYYNVTCFRSLARNVAFSLHKGDPVLVTGTLSLNDWATDERSGTSADIVAASIGHDLTFGVGAFRRNPRLDPPAGENGAGGNGAGEPGDGAGSGGEGADGEDADGAAVHEPLARVPEPVF